MLYYFHESLGLLYGQYHRVSAQVMLSMSLHLYGWITHAYASERSCCRQLIESRVGAEDSLRQTHPPSFTITTWQRHAQAFLRINKSDVHCVGPCRPVSGLTSHYTDSASHLLGDEALTPGSRWNQGSDNFPSQPTGNCSCRFYNT